jgi:hypothetical protein
MKKSKKFKYQRYAVNGGIVATIGALAYLIFKPGAKDMATNISSPSIAKKAVSKVKAAFTKVKSNVTKKTTSSKAATNKAPQHTDIDEATAKPAGTLPADKADYNYPLF